MELAKITSKGQITIPKAIREKLNVKDGDKVLFTELNGHIVIENPVMLALKNAQSEFAGEAQRLGLKNEEDVADMVREIRGEE